MHVQEIEFAVQKENGIVTKIGKSAVYQPKAGFKGSQCSMKCHQNVSAVDTQNKNRKG